MKRRSMTWRDDFASNEADGYDEHGKREPHDRRKSVPRRRLDGHDDRGLGEFLAGFLRGEGLSANARAEMLQPQIAIRSAHQFPTLESARKSGSRRQDRTVSRTRLRSFRGPSAPLSTRVDITKDR